MQFDWVSFLLSFFKFVGIGLSGTFGVLGLVTEVRDKNTGKITRWGRIALGGVVTSTLVAATSQTLEIGKSDEEEAAARNNFQSEIHEIARSVEPLDSIAFTFEATVRLDDPAVLAYRNRVLPLIAHYLATKNEEASPEGIYVATRQGGLVTKLAIKVDSPSFPNMANSNEIVAYEALRYPDFTFAVFKRAVPFSSTILTGDWSAKVPDLVIASSTADTGVVALTYDVASKSFGIRCVSTTPPKDSWVNNGDVASILDLLDSQVFFVFASRDEYLIGGRPVPGIDRIRRTIRLNDARVELPRGQYLMLNSQNMALHQTIAGLAGYDVVLPKSFESARRIGISH